MLSIQSTTTSCHRCWNRGLVSTALRFDGFNPISKIGRRRSSLTDTGLQPTMLTEVSSRALFWDLYKSYPTRKTRRWFLKRHNIHRHLFADDKQAYAKASLQGVDDVRGRLAFMTASLTSVTGVRPVGSSLKRIRRNSLDLKNIPTSLNLPTWSRR